MCFNFSTESSVHALLRLAGRVFVYALLLGAIAAGMLWGAVKYGPGFYDEIGPVETLETVFAMLTALVFLCAGRIHDRCAPCAILLAGFLFCVMVRESDYFLDVLVGRHTWKVIVACILVAMVLYLVRNLQRAIESITDFMRQPSFGVFMSGLLVLIVFSRLFGYGPFWKELISGNYYRVIKTIVEEGVEQMGYFLLLISSFEYLHATRFDLQKHDKHMSG